MVSGTHFTGHLRGVHQLYIVFAVPGGERVHLSLACHLADTGRHHGRIEPAAQGNAHPGIGLDLTSQGIQETLPEPGRMPAFVLMKHLYRNVPEPGRVHPVEIHLEPRTRGNRMNPLETGGTRLDPLGRLDDLKGITIGPSRQGCYRQKSLVLAGENEPVVIAGEVQGRVANAVPGENQSALRRIGDRHGELA
jgi:hypothetical protein